MNFGPEREFCSYSGHHFAFRRALPPSANQKQVNFHEGNSMHKDHHPKSAKETDHRADFPLQSESAGEKHAISLDNAPISINTNTVQRMQMNSASLTPTDVLQLQRLIGNRATHHLLEQSKASAGGQARNAPLPAPSPIAQQRVQRDEDEETSSEDFSESLWSDPQSYEEGEDDDAYDYHDDDDVFGPIPEGWDQVYETNSNNGLGRKQPKSQRNWNFIYDVDAVSRPNPDLDTSIPTPRTEKQRRKLARQKLPWNLRSHKQKGRLTKWRDTLKSKWQERAVKRKLKKRVKEDQRLNKGYIKRRKKQIRAVKRERRAMKLHNKVLPLYKRLPFSKLGAQVANNPNTPEIYKHMPFSETMTKVAKHPMMDRTGLSTFAPRVVRHERFDDYDFGEIDLEEAQLRQKVAEKQQEGVTDYQEEDIGMVNF